MPGYRNLVIILAALGVSAWVAIVGIQSGTDPMGLATVIGAINGGVVGGIFGRGFNKKHAPEQ